MQLCKEQQNYLMNKLSHPSKSVSKLRSYEKFNDFFGAKDQKKPYIYEQEQENPFNVLATKKLIRSNSLAIHMEQIQEKSSIKGKIQTYLNDTRKMGVLQHVSKANIKTLAKIADSQKKIPNTEITQNRAYLTKLRKEYNDFCSKNMTKESQLRNIEANIHQVRQKIVFYKGLLSMTLQQQQQQLKDREQKIKEIRFEEQILRSMKSRLKQINYIYKKRVKTDQTLQRAALNKNILLNEQVGHTKEGTDKKKYATVLFQSVQTAKTEQIANRSTAAQINIQLEGGAQSLKKKQEAIVIFQRDQYDYQTRTAQHNKLLRDLRALKFQECILDASKNRFLVHYKEYEKCQKLMKMYALDPDFQVKQSHQRSFELCHQLKQRIQDKEQRIKQLEARNHQLCDDWVKVSFSGIQIDSLDSGTEQLRQYLKSYPQRTHRALFKIQLVNRIKLWLKQQEQKLKVKPSKKSTLTSHLLLIMETVLKEVKQLEANNVQSEPTNKSKSTVSIKKSKRK